MQEIKLNGESMNIVEDNIEKLKTIFPDVFTEGKVDFEKLQGVLGNYIETNDERYNFTWAGKQNALRLAQTPSTGTLRPCKEESKNWDTTQNLYIEGDNLEVLKLLQKSYHNKIKMIYIDPPYNTGNDFVYKDDFKDNIENYKKITGQVDEEGNKISSNSESDGRYHTNWLNMMYPRLRLARNLLSNDGAIFISIDDREQENLKKIMSEIFGEQNCIGVGQWRRVEGKPGKSLNMARTSEFVLIYAKNLNLFKIGTLPLSQDGIKEFRYSDKKGKFRRGQIYYPNRGIHNYSIVSPYGNTISGDFTIKQSVFEEYQKQDKIYWAEQGDHTPYLKIYLSEFEGVMPTNTFGKDYGSSQSAVKEFKELFNMDSMLFDNPKPTKLLKRLLLIGNLKKDSIILDFFSGSATTAHAVMQLNSEDNGNRKFICVQLPEQTEEKSEAFKNGYKNICEIGKERIRRAGEKIKQEIEQENQQLKLGEEPKKVPDIGFKVFKLDSSNIKKWNANTENLEEQLQQSILNQVAGRSELDVVYEIMLKCGLDLTYPIEEIKVEDKSLYSIGAGAMFICMDDNITQSIADKIIAIKEENELEEPVVVFKDNGFIDDSTKTNIKESLRVAGIKDFITV